MTAVGQIKVHCVGQEYWYIGRSRCKCGGTYATDMQAVAYGPEGPVDMVSAHCTSCGAGQSFAFSIAKFFGAYRDAMALARLVSTLEGEQIDERLKEQLRRAAEPPMEATLAFLRQLAEDGDDLALEYIDDAIREFRSQASAT